MTNQNIVGEGGKAGNCHFLLFSQCFPPFVLKTNFVVSFFFFFFLSANIFSLVESKLFSCGEELTLSQTKDCHLQSFSVWKSLKFVVWGRVKHRIV